MARKGKGIRWVKISDTERVRPLPDGQYLWEQRENVKRSQETREQMRKTADEIGIANATEAKGTSLRMFATAPQSLHHEMMRTCGHDPEKQARFFGDHPELLVVPRNSAKVKGRSITSYPGQKRKR